MRNQRTMVHRSAFSIAVVLSMAVAGAQDRPAVHAAPADLDAYVRQGRPSTYDRREIAHRLRFIKPATSFRSAYAYDNVLYLVAGELIAAVTGQTWEDFVSTRILAKVGMSGTNVRHSMAKSGGNIATT